jgi:hypothetical protein
MKSIVVNEPPLTDAEVVEGAMKLAGLAGLLLRIKRGEVSQEQMLKEYREVGK